MKDKQIKIYRIVSILSLAAILMFTIWAYFKMDKVFIKAEMSMMSIDFQIFVGGIILSAFTSFFISWRLLLNIVVIKADYKDELHRQDVENISKKENKTQDQITDWSSALSDDSSKLLQNLCRLLEIDIARKYDFDGNQFNNSANYAIIINEEEDSSFFKYGEGLNGQVAQNKKPLLLNDIPENYIKITSGSGQISPRNIYIIPVIKDGKTKCILELADMKSEGETTYNKLQEFSAELAKTLKLG